MTASATSYPIYTHGEIMDFRKAVASMPGLRQGPKLLFNAIVSNIKVDKGCALITDDQLAVDYGCADRTTIYRHRKKLLKAGVIGFKPGRFKQMSTYWISLTPQRRDDMLTMRSDRRNEARTVAKASAEARYAALRNAAEEEKAEIDSVALSAETATQSGSQNCNTATLRNCSTSFPSITPYEGLTDRKEETCTRETQPSKPDPNIAIPIAEPSVGREHGIEIPTWLTDDDRQRGAHDVDRYLDRVSDEAGVSVHEAEAALGDELHRMRLRVAIFPGDNIHAFKRIDRTVADIARWRHAAE
jgi:hypothetical protein